MTENLWRDGAVLLGKTNNDEFAMGSSSKPPVSVRSKPRGGGAVLIQGWCRWIVRRCGGGGRGAGGVAATGTDTGGSIRQPASFCGIVGLKPSYGRCSRWGVVAYASSLDHPGPMTRTVQDAAILLAAMAGHDPRDFDLGAAAGARLRSGTDRRHPRPAHRHPQEYRHHGMRIEIENVWYRAAHDWLREAGAEIVEVNLPHTKYALPAYYIIAPAEASSNLARYDGVRFGLRVDGDSLDDMYELTRAEGFGAEVRRRVLIGTYVLSAGYYDAYYLKAQRVRALVARDFAQAFERVDYLLTPTAPSTAFAIGEIGDDPVTMYLNDAFTVPANLAGLPAISVPSGL